MGKVHGAVNTLVSLYEDPEDWCFKQFVSIEQMEQYATDNMLVVTQEKQE